MAVGCKLHPEERSRTSEVSELASISTPAIGYHRYGDHPGCSGIRIHGWLVVTPATHTPEAGRDPGAPRRPGSRPSPQPCEGNLLYRHLRSEWQRLAPLDRAGLQARQVPRHRPLQHRRRQPRSPGSYGSRARLRDPDHNPERTGVARRRHRRAHLRRRHPAGLLRLQQSRRQQGPEQPEAVHRPSSRDPSVSRLGQAAPPLRKLGRDPVQ